MTVLDFNFNLFKRFYIIGYWLKTEDLIDEYDVWFGIGGFNYSSKRDKECGLYIYIYIPWGKYTINLFNRTK